LRNLNIAALFFVPLLTQGAVGFSQRFAVCGIIPELPFYETTMKIGVFTCWCGENIARTVDCEKVTEEVANIPGVHCAVTYKYMCSEPGQQLIHQKIKELGLTAVVVAACSPHMHLKTFRKAVETAGINPFLAEVANIREHCSWVHPNRNEATAKAIELIRMAVEKVKHNHTSAGHEKRNLNMKAGAQQSGTTRKRGASIAVLRETCRYNV